MPQKNSGATASKKAPESQSKSSKFLQLFLTDFRRDGKVDDVYVARVLSKIGNGRVEVFYIDSTKKPQNVQCIIPGRFSGKEKRSAWISNGTVVMVSDSQIPGSARFEVVAVLTPKDIAELQTEMTLDTRILEKVEESELMKDSAPADSGYVFELDIDNM